MKEAEVWSRNETVSLVRLLITSTIEWVTRILRVSEPVNTAFWRDHGHRTGSLNANGAPVYARDTSLTVLFPRSQTTKTIVWLLSKTVSLICSKEPLSDAVFFPFGCFWTHPKCCDVRRMTRNDLIELSKMYFCRQKSFADSASSCHDVFEGTTVANRLTVEFCCLVENRQVFRLYIK